MARCYHEMVYSTIFPFPLLLLGTVHGDPRGYERALKLLRRFQPTW